MRAGLDLVDTTIAAMDNEKDPRCLLLAFEVTQVSFHLMRNLIVIKTTETVVAG